MLNKRKSIFFILVLCNSICWAERFCINFLGDKNINYQLILYFNPISEYTERNLEQIRAGAYKESKISNLSYTQVKKIFKNIKKEKLEIIQDFLVNDEIKYIDFLLNKNAHSFAEIIDCNGNTILYFTFDEYYSPYMVINDSLVEKSISLYKLIEKDINQFVENSVERKKELQEIEKARNWDF